MLLLDEALAAVAGSEVDDFCVAGGDLLPALLGVRARARRRRAPTSGSGSARRSPQRRNLPGGLGVLPHALRRRAHRGRAVARGRRALTEAVRLWGLGQRSVCASGALVRLADLRVRQGRFEEAEQLLDGLDVSTDADAARPLAAIHLARGETALAGDVLERALGADRPARARPPRRCWRCSSTCTSRRASSTTAELAADQLAACASAHPSDYLDARAPRSPAGGSASRPAPATRRPACARRSPASRGRRCRWSSRTAGSSSPSALAADRPEVAMAEARAALEAFEQLQAARDADAAAAVLRSLGVRTATHRPRRRGS